MKTWLLALACCWLTISAWASPQFEPNARGILFLKGPSAGFDLGSRHVYFKQVKADNPNLMIYAHGGGGLGRADRTRAALFGRFGFDVLSFDAFAMNEVQALWANRNLSDESKQQLVINVLTGAIQHANALAHYQNIVLYGQSNGARAILLVLNELAEIDKRKIKMILSEAPSSHGKAMPDTLDIPTHFFVGAVDNWGGNAESDLMWTRFNYLTRGTNQAWYEQQVKKGSPVHLTVYEGAGHGFHAGPLQGVERNLAGRGKTTGYLGADPAVVQTYENALESLVKPFNP